MFLLRTGTISAVCGRTVALLLESRASSNPFVLLADNTAALAQYSRVNMIFMGIDTYANLPCSPKLPCTKYFLVVDVNYNWSNTRPKLTPEQNCTDTWKYFAPLALIPVSISCVMDLPVMSAHRDLIQTDRSPYYQLLRARELSGWGKWSLVRLNIGPGGRTKPWALLYITEDGENGNGPGEALQFLNEVREDVCITWSCSLVNGVALLQRLLPFWLHSPI